MSNKAKITNVKNKEPEPEEQYIGKFKNANEFFVRERNIIREKQVAIHIEGIELKLDRIETQFHRKNIENGHYDQVPYISLQKMANLEPTYMVRLDQLPTFQDDLS